MVDNWKFDNEDFAVLGVNHRWQSLRARGGVSLKNIGLVACAPRRVVSYL
jgi:hypothetical protein